MILSASRRSDLPGYYSEWFFNRLKEGYALYRNPMNHAQVCRVDLSVGNIDGIVFWTKDPDPMMGQLEQLDRMGYSYYFQFTLTPYGLPFTGSETRVDSMQDREQGLEHYGKEIEPYLRDKRDILTTFRQLSNRLGRNRVLWRYDPIILNASFTMDYHKNQFAYLCQELAGYTDTCTISFVDRYNKLSKKVKEQVLREITAEEMHYLAAELVRIAKPYHIELRACCETIDLSEDGIMPAACIDKEIMERVCGHSIEAKKDKSQRSGCGCVQSVDIGAYNTCRNGCVYCYANHSETSICKNLEKHDPKSPMLIGNIDKG
jgi:hypothetical protein